MLEHCVEAFASSSEWLAQLDIDEFLSVAPSDSVSDAPSLDSGTLSYPLLDLLASPDLDSAACVPLPLLNFRNYGIRELRTQGLLETQVRRDVSKATKTGLDSTRNHQRVRRHSPFGSSALAIRRADCVVGQILLHTAYAEKPTVTFAGAHSCFVSTQSDDGASSPRTAIKTSAGDLLQEGGRYEAVPIPTEPLAVAREWLGSLGVSDLHLHADELHLRLQTMCSATCVTVSPSSLRWPIRMICTHGVGACSPARSTTSRRRKNSRLCHTTSRTDSCLNHRQATRSCSTDGWRTAGQPGRRAKSGDGGKLRGTDCPGAGKDRVAITTTCRGISLTGHDEKSKSSTSSVRRGCEPVSTRQNKTIPWTFFDSAVVALVALGRVSIIDIIKLPAACSAASARGERIDFLSAT